MENFRETKDESQTYQGFLESSVINLVSIYSI